jgi:restriction system protein
VNRRRQGLIQELLAAFTEGPFWVSILGAAFFFLLLRFVAPLLAGNSMSGKALATVAQTIAPWAAIAIASAGLIGVGKRRWKRLLLSKATGLTAFRQMSWPDLELLVGEVFRQQGYSVSERGGRHADGGIDLELVRGREKVIVQCKHWLNRQVPVQRVRELLGVVTAEGADRGILVATSGFTRDAREFAAGKPLQLIDGEALIKLAHPSAGVIAARTSDVSPQTPACPTCGKPMVSRMARRGPKTGSQFWGCSSYPDCRGTRAA